MARAWKPWEWSWLRRQERFGTRNNANTLSEDSASQEILCLLERTTPFDALGALMGALRPEASAVPIGETAIALDANVFLRLSNHNRLEDIVDYLRTSHAGPLVLPGQVIQEFWNNQFTVVDSLAVSVKKKFAALKEDIEKIDPSFGEFSERFSAVSDEFIAEYSYIYDEATLRRIQSIIDVFKERAIVPFARRETFRDAALVRKKTKTPPGFKDDGDGDFFVWVDLLTGLHKARREGQIFKRVALVSLEKKMDWGRGGTPHPILSAEMAALTGASLEIWTTDRLARELLD